MAMARTTSKTETSLSEKKICARPIGSDWIKRNPSIAPAGKGGGGGPRSKNGWGTNASRSRKVSITTLNGMPSGATLNRVANHVPTASITTADRAERIMAAIAQTGFQAPLPNAPKNAIAAPTSIPFNPKIPFWMVARLALRAIAISVALAVPTKLMPPSQGD
jgi:hypothetical protein